jgi:predicted DNA-binding transcriptional regulator AlpA
VARFISFSELPDYGVPAFSRKHFLDLQKRGRFPKARQLSANRIAWLEDEILDWVASRPVARSVAKSVTELPQDPPIAKSVAELPVDLPVARSFGFRRGQRAGVKGAAE